MESSDAWPKDGKATRSDPSERGGVEEDELEAYSEGLGVVLGALVRQGQQFGDGQS